MRLSLSSLANTAYIIPLLALIPLACVDKPNTTSEGATATATSDASTSAGSSGSSGSSSTSADATSTTGAGSTGGPSSTDGSSGGSSSGGETGDACETPLGAYDPWLEPLGPGDEPCDFPSDEACVTADALAGFRRCLSFEIAEDMTESSWGPCMPSCSPDEREDARACGPGEAGVSYCGQLFIDGDIHHVWFPCLDPSCLECAPGDTELCGPDTPYPDTLKTCDLSFGVPLWFDGDCYT
ncbi:MAG: hypothetical protein H6710_23240 [Myxococcales bacterium]|nr:hypothetical protein [Myxococcales bacterium]